MNDSLKFIQSVQNDKVKEWKKLMTKKGREKANQFIVEGFHLVEEALKKDYASVIIVDENIEIPHGWNVDNIEMYHISSAVAKALGETETTQGVFAICEQKPLHLSTYSRVLLLDGVQDPGNIGTIIRTADAAGVELIVCGNGCVDVYNGKSLRSTQGSIFHIPVLKGDLQEWIPRLQDQGITVYGTSLQNAKDYREVQLADKYALVMGNEGNGVSDAVLEQCDQNLYIPILGEAESLNVTVATGILLYQFCK